jgi:hypothetical protein
VQIEVLELDERFGKEYAGRYMFGEISWARRSRIIQKHTKYSQLTGQILSSDYIAIQAETIWASLKEQPPQKPITLDKILSEEDGIPAGLGERFSQIVNRLCGISQEETAFLSEPCADRNQAKCSRNSECAKNSGGRQNSLQNNQQKPFSNSSSSSTS